MKTKIVNLTPHAIVCAGITTQPSGTVARLESTEHPAGELAGMPLTVVEFGQTVNLPEPQDGVWIIVSAMVRTANPLRVDLLSPGRLERDESGAVIGCAALIANIDREDAE